MQVNRKSEIKEQSLIDQSLDPAPPDASTASALPPEFTMTHST